MEEPKKEKLTKELQGMALATVGAIVLLAFLTYHSADVSWNSYSNEGGYTILEGGSELSWPIFFSAFSAWRRI